MAQKSLLHSFYIPVMGIGFTIDTPLLVAKYGISSVISLVDDILVEQMRKYWSEQYHESYTPITADDEDPRSRRITSYLNLLHKLIDRQISELKNLPFVPNNELAKYFELLPEHHHLSQAYREMLVMEDSVQKEERQKYLRQAIVPGSIDVNIMTKLDCENYRYGSLLPQKFFDAAAALRGYAKSDLSSTIVLSAGFNPRLYGYLPEFDDFFPDENQNIKKKICLKVSDYRSALIQGKYLAKRGIWVSEYRIESALNCGGHAFINDGQLLGPILEEFKSKRNQLIDELHAIYQRSLVEIKGQVLTDPIPVKITAQGGVGTNSEHEFLIKRYELDGVGWGSPFLLVPDVTNVDEVTLQKLINAKEDDVYLSHSSPVGIPFWNLKHSLSEDARAERIKQGTPGSACIKGFIQLSREFTDRAICTASRQYQKLKLAQLEASQLPAEKLALLKEEVLAKSCICHDLGGGVLLKREIEQNVAPAICPGPNIINFKKIASLKEMVGHIYGRCSLLVGKDRPHVFIKEIQLHLANLLNEIKDASLGMPARSEQKLQEVKKNLLAGIEYYQSFAKEVINDHLDSFLKALHELSLEIERISLEIAVS